MDSEVTPDQKLLRWCNERENDLAHFVYELETDEEVYQAMQQLFKSFYQLRVSIHNG